MCKSPDLNSNDSRTRLGSYLIEAGLITPAQVSVVLNDQQIETDMRFGEVLVARGWVKLETIEFIMTRVVEPERRATHNYNLAESEKQTQSLPTHPLHNSKMPSSPVKDPVDRSTLPAATPQTRKPAPPPYPTTPPIVARAQSLDGNFEFEIFSSRPDTGSLDPNSLSGASKTNAHRNDRKSLPSVSEDGGVNWAG
jgi:hypothetical protein